MGSIYCRSSSSPQLEKSSSSSRRKTSASVACNLAFGLWVAPSSGRILSWGTACLCLCSVLDEVSLTGWGSPLEVANALRRFSFRGKLDEVSLIMVDLVV